MRVNHFRELSEMPALTPESQAMSKALKRQGFRFVGPTTCYAFMQACGLVNDHLVSCYRHSECVAFDGLARTCSLAPSPVVA